jgi:calmodulin
MSTSDVPSTCEAEMKAAFDLYDEDKDGLITWKEMLKLMTKLGLRKITETDVKQAMAEMDLNGDGMLDFFEFKRLLKHLLRDLSSQELREAFSLFDKDGNGFISAQELYHVIALNLEQKLSREDVELMIKQADTDGDHQVNYFEFLQIMSPVAKSLESVAF